MVRPATMIRAIVIWPLALTALFGVDSRVLAQGETTAAILGQVSDSSNAALQGATVTVTNRDRGLKRSALTDGEGRFNFPQLLPGTYVVQATAEGFQAQTIENVFAGLG
ncbi:MAG: carboxypeptidase-like regulatory domain-containing protein, partial [Candidatus Acidiferrum sp.]